MTDPLQGVLPCPFCGKPVDPEDPDTLHPTGSGWRDDEVEGFRTYHRYTDVPKAQWCWGMHCPTTAGGCGAEISGDSKEEVLAKWNRRTPGSVHATPAANGETAPIIQENGPWAAGETGETPSRTFVESDDFTHDVRLYLNGDFEDNEQRRAYAEEIAQRLNAWQAPTPSERG